MKQSIFLVFLIFFPCFANNPKVAVFCSADDKAPLEFKNLAYQLGQQLGINNFGLITGGSRTGLMKEIVDGYTNQKGNPNQLYGILPLALKQFNVQHQSIPQENLKWAQNIHERLLDFHQLADIIIVLPGGYGTLHELMDFLVHNQFGIHKTQILLINLNGFWDPFLTMLNTMQSHNLLAKKHFDILSVVISIDECIAKILCKDSSNSEHGLNTYYWEKK